jgi:hypothetical protein
MARLRNPLSRRPPIIAPPELVTSPDLQFGLDVRAERAGWTVAAYGPDGRRIGRPLKGLSQGVQETLTAAVDRIQDPADRRRLAAAWVGACREAVTNAEVLTGFTDAAARLAAKGGSGTPVPGRA